MIPLELTVRNFLSYGDAPVTLDFTGFHVACLTGDNGHGKSALLDAITYALWGQARKGRGDRKPDEGLLRLGAEEMQVSFAFELDERRFRVQRSFRRRRRSTTGELELQAWDPAGGAYRPLTESSAMSRTQERIDQLLAMDYETFINSAFILQGRADEFTRKSARERKSILAEILGLSRYDRLQERARQRLGEQEKLSGDLQRQGAEMDEQLAEGDTWRERLAELESSLTELAQALAGGEAALEAATRALAEAEARRQRLTELGRDAERLNGLLADLVKRREQLEAERLACDAAMDQAEQIEARGAEHGQLTEEAARLNAELSQVREQELAIARLETRLREARHGLEANLAALGSRRDEIQAQVAEALLLVDQEAQIGAAHRELGELRRREAALVEQQDRHRALEEQRVRLEHEVQVKSQRLQERRDLLARREAELAAQVATRPAVEAEARRCEAQLAEAQRAAARLDQLRDEGTRLRTRSEELVSQHAQAVEERRHIEERARRLAEAEVAECPLCGTVLDGPHRTQAETELAAQRQRQDLEVEGLARQREETQRRLEKRREEYRSLEPAPAQLETAREALSQLRSRLPQLREAEESAARLAVERGEIDRLLASGQYAPEAGTSLQALTRQISELGYDTAALTEVRARLRDAAAADTRWAQLEEARQRLGRGQEQLAELDRRRTELEGRLESGAEVAEPARRLEELRAEAAAVGYDGTRHARVRARLEELAAAPSHMAQLEEARRTRAGLGEALGHLARQESDLSRQRAEVVAAADQLRQQSADDEAAARRAAALRREVAERRQRREELLQEAGSARSRCQQLEALEVRRRDLAARERRAERQAWLYRQLAQAFGKDGIQALVIEGAVPEIEEEANQLLRRLTDNRIQVTIESLRDLKGGGTRETLDIQIADELGVRSYSMYSGGEAFRTDFALRIALSRVLARRAGTQLRTLIVDEGFGTQDRHGLEQLKEAIQEVSNDFDKLLVVTHLPELKDVFPVQIEVTKDPELGSQLQVVDLR